MHIRAVALVMGWLDAAQQPIGDSTHHIEGIHGCGSVMGKVHYLVMLLLLLEWYTGKGQQSLLFSACTNDNAHTATDHVQ